MIIVLIKLLIKIINFLDAKNYGPIKIMIKIIAYVNQMYNIVIKQIIKILQENLWEIWLIQLIIVMVNKEE